MKKEARRHEIVENLKGCSRDFYFKDEVLTELLELQKETVEMTFNKDHSELAGLRIWDVENHLTQLNSDCQGIATEALSRFKDDCRELCNQIKSEFSGSKGENLAEKYLRSRFESNVILKNIELSNEMGHTELDLVVVKPSGVSIIEVKNTAKNIFIDKNGDYYRAGVYNKLDCNIAYKMKFREELLKDLLINAGNQNIPVESVLVFTNNTIEVQNRCNDIKTCFLCQLSDVVSEDDANSMFDAKEIAEAIRNNADKKAYPLEFDAKKFKEDFAEVMVLLESANECEDNETIKVVEKIKEPEMKNENKPRKVLVSVLDYVKRNPWKVACAAALLGAPILSSFATAAVLSKGGNK